MVTEAFLRGLTASPRCMVHVWILAEYKEASSSYGFLVASALLSEPLGLYLLIALAFKIKVGK